MKEGLLKENIDGEALEWAHKRLIKREENLFVRKCQKTVLRFYLVHLSETALMMLIMFFIKTLIFSI